MVCAPASIYGVCTCFHILCVYLLPYMVCTPASIYGVCACFHIWCEPNYCPSAGLSAWHLNSPARYIWAFLWWLPGRSRQSEQSICTGQLLCAVEVVASATAGILATALEGLVRISLMSLPLVWCGVVWCRSVVEHLRRSGSVRERDSQELQPGSSLSGKCRRGIPHDITCLGEHCSPPLSLYYR